jgi:hypothetical protein
MDGINRIDWISRNNPVHPVDPVHPVSPRETILKISPLSIEWGIESRDEKEQTRAVCHGIPAA